MTNLHVFEYYYYYFFNNLNYLSRAGGEREAVERGSEAVGRADAGWAHRACRGLPLVK